MKVCFFIEHMKKWLKDVVCYKRSCGDYNKHKKNENVSCKVHERVYKGSSDTPYCISEEYTLYGKVYLENCLVEKDLTVYGEVYVREVCFQKNVFLYGNISGSVKGDITCTGMAQFKNLVVDGSVYLKNFAGSMKHVHIKGDLYISKDAFSVSRKYVQVDGEVIEQ